MSFYAHAFEAAVEPLNWDGTRYTVIRLPSQVAAALPLQAHPRLRVEGEVGEIPMTWTWNPAPAVLGEGWFAYLSRAKLKERGLAVGHVASVSFNLADQDGVDVPAELLLALAGDEGAQAAWDALTPGRRRGLAHMVESAKRQQTRDKRTQQIVGALAAGEDPFPPRARRARA